MHDCRLTSVTSAVSFQGYLTEHGQVSLNRVQLIMSELGVMEDEIFKKRQQTEEMFRARDKAKRKRMRMANNRDRPNRILSGQYAPTVRRVDLCFSITRT